MTALRLLMGISISLAIYVDHTSARTAPSTIEAQEHEILDLVHLILAQGTKPGGVNVKVLQILAERLKERVERYRSRLTDTASVLVVDLQKLTAAVEQVLHWPPADMADLVKGVQSLFETLQVVLTDLRVTKGRVTDPTPEQAVRRKRKAEGFESAQDVACCDCASGTVCGSSCACG